MSGHVAAYNWVEDPHWMVNARGAAPSTVARGFIAPSHFKVLVRPSHTLIIGPRGSGKTTLLKMLTLEALTTDDAGKRILGVRGVPFTGVFVPTDIAWASQLSSFESLGFEQGFADAFLETSFAVAIQRALVYGIGQRLAVTPEQGGYLKMGAIDFDASREVQLAKSLAYAWDLEIPVPSLLGLRSALSKRLLTIGTLAARESQRPADGRADRLSAAGLGAPLIPTITAALDAAIAVIPELADQKWALLFDELELAPAQIRNRLLEAMRSVDGRLFFKMALSPFGADMNLLQSALSAMPGHDYDEVSLSYGRKEDGYEFTLDLMQSILEKKHQAKDLLAVFGVSVFPIETKLAARFRDVESRAESVLRQNRAVRDLYRSDKSFRRYVDRVAGSLDRVLALKGDDRAQKLRKILPLVIVRSAFRVPDASRSHGQRRYTSRKNPQIYAGLVSLAAMLEGNPRWIVGMLNTLLETSPGTSVSADRQAAEISRTVNRFRALLTTIPVPQLGAKRQRGLVGFLDTLGSHFRNKIIADDFTADPVGSFAVDPHASDELTELVGAALNAGAIVHVPGPGGSAILTSLRGKRFRLSYLLAAEYGLPLRLEREASLSALLAKPKAGDPETLF